MGVIDIFRRIDELYGLTPQEEREIDDTIRSEVEDVNQVVSEKIDTGITSEDVKEKAAEVTEREDVVNVMSKNIPAFSDCRNWRDVAKVMGKECTRVQKEMFFTQVFAGGVCLVLLDNVTPAGKFILGPVMVKVGYSNSEFLKRFAPKDFVENLARVDVSKVKNGKE